MSELGPVVNYKDRAVPKKPRDSGWEIAIKVFEVCVVVAVVGLLGLVILG